MKKINLKKGFTLLELLVVAAIITMLIAIVIVSIDSSRDKAADSAIKSNLVTIRAQAEIFAISSGTNGYLPSGGSTFSINTCPTPYNAAGANMMVRDKVVFDAITEATFRGGNGNSCYNSIGEWAVAVGLKSDANKSWCVDRAGASREVNSAPGSAINGTTFTCN